MKARFYPWIFLSTLLFSCANHEVDGVTHRLVLEDESCPDADDVEREENANDATLESETRVPSTPLCWYRVESADDDPPCEVQFESSFAELRQTWRNAIKPSATGYSNAPFRALLCSSDAGHILVWQAAGDRCAVHLTPSRRWEDSVRGWELERQLVPQELLAVDPQPPYRSCRYAMRMTRKSGGCGRFPMLSP